MKIRIGTRGSELALTQTRAIAARIAQAIPNAVLEEVVLKTSGDRDTTTPLSAQGGVGVFTKELERALLDHEIDLAVHSLKDLPTVSPPGLQLGAIPERASPWDAFISDRYADLGDLPDGGVVATGSLRRRAQILHWHPRLEVIGIRGNIDTRLAKYLELGAVGLILAEAGLVRTGREGVIRSRLGPTEMTPAPGQGALGLEIREDAAELFEALRPIDHEVTRQAVTAERCFLRELEGGCHLPIGAFARVSGGQLVLTGMLATADGSRRLQLATEGLAGDGEAVASALVKKVLKAGGDSILATYRDEAESS